MNGTARTPSRLFISIPGVPLLGTGPTSGTLGDTATDLWQSGAKFCHFRLFGCLQHSFAHRHLPQAPSPPPASALPSAAPIASSALSSSSSPARNPSRWHSFRGAPSLRSRSGPLLSALRPRAPVSHVPLQP